MVTAKVGSLSPLVDTLPDSSGRTQEDVHIGRLLSENTFARANSSEWLRKNGNSLTAEKLEAILSDNHLPREIKKEVAQVLIHISHRHLDFGTSHEKAVSRIGVLAGALSSAYRRSRLRS